MVKTGNAVCPRCGKLNSCKERYYHNANNRFGGLLTKTGSRSYEIKPYLPTVKNQSENTPNTNEDDAQFEAEHLELLENDPYIWKADSIKVSVGEENRVQTWQRCCKYCNVHTELPGVLGTVPTFVFLLAGMPDTGKSSLLDRLSRRSSLPNEISGTNLVLEPWYDQDGKESDRMKTEANGLGETAWLLLSEKTKKAKTLVAMILLRDLPGEMYTNPNYAQELSDFYRPRIEREHRLNPSDYDYAPDGLMLVGRCYTNNATVINAITRNGNANDLLNSIPVAVIVTHLDELFEPNKLQGKDRTLTESYLFTIDQGNHKIPLDLSTLRRMVGTLTIDGGETRWEEKKVNGSDLMVPAVFRKRLAEEHNILLNMRYTDPEGKLMKPIMTGYIGSYGSISRGFLIKSCTNIGKEEDNVKNWSTPINILDPLFWMLAHHWRDFKDYRQGGVQR